MRQVAFAVIVFTLGLLPDVAHGQAQSSWTAQFVDSPMYGSVILVDLGGPYIVDAASHVATLADGKTILDLRRVRILSPEASNGEIVADAVPSSGIDPHTYLSLEISNFRDSSGAVKLDSFTSGSRTYLLILQSNKGDQMYAISVAVQAKGSPKLVASTLAAPVRNEIIVRADNLNTTAVVARLAADKTKLSVTYDFGQDATVSNIVTGVDSIRFSDSNPDVFSIKPRRSLPYHATPYKVSIQIPKNDVPGALQPPSGNVFTLTSTANFPAPAVTEPNATYDFQPTLTSAVNRSKGTRVNTGLFVLTAHPVLFLHEQMVDGKPRKNSYWMDFRPNLSANIDTLPEKTSTTPNRITIALDEELGLARLRGAVAPVRPEHAVDQFAWTNGVRTDTDRDFKVFSTYWHTDLAFDPWKGSESQAYRTQNLLPAGTVSKASKTPFITAYRLRPSFGYELGSTTVRSGTIDPVLGTSVSRALLKLDTMLEIKRNVSFAVVDTGYYLANASRRLGRDFLDAQIAVNTGLLIRMDTEKIQSAITLKYQRGEQPPRFTPVNTISLGMKFYK